MTQDCSSLGDRSAPSFLCITPHRLAARASQCWLSVPSTLDVIVPSSSNQGKDGLEGRDTDPGLSHCYLPVRSLAMSDQFSSGR